MTKLFSFHEWLGTGIQLIIFTLLFPFLVIILGMLPFADGAIEGFADSVMSFVYLSEYVEGAVIGLNTANPAMGIVEYGTVLLDIVTANIEAFMYVGMWLYAFRVIFSEILTRQIVFKHVTKIVPIFNGVPIIQVTLGLFFGALTYSMLGDRVLNVMIIAFLTVLNWVLTLIFVDKPVWKKILDAFINISMQSYLAALTAGYVIVLMFCLNGVYATVWQAVTAVVTVTLLWLVYLVTQYLLTDK